MPNAYAVPGFASARKSGGLKPFDERVLIAEKRYKAALTKYHGVINARSTGDAVQFGLDHVFNRGYQLGGHRNGELKKVITRAVMKMLEEKVLLLEDGRLALNGPFTQPKQRNQKYPQRRLQVA